MKWSVPLARVAGIPIRIHVSFLLLLGWIAWMGWGAGDGYRSSLWAVALILALFFCVVLHELGHSLVAIHFGAEVSSVTLYPIGGVARMKAIPEKPLHELLVSLAGPSVNVAILLLLALVRGGFPAWMEMESFPTSAGQLVDSLIRANAILAIFNLLPAFPMDGGRVLRSFLALFLPHGKATAVAAALGQVLAVGFILLGLAVNPFLVVIGIFVFFGAETESRMVRIRGMLRDVHAEDIMVTDFPVLSPDDTLERCLDYVYHHRQEDFVVVFEDRVVGILARRDWLSALHKAGPATSVATVMRRNFISLDARTPLSKAYQRLASLGQSVFPVMRDGQVAGLLTTEDVSRYLLVQQARRRPGDQESPGADERGRSSPFSIDLG